MDLAATVREARQHAGLTQSDLGARAGLPAETVADMESGRIADPPWSTVDRLIRAAGGRLAVQHIDGSAARPSGSGEPAHQPAADPRHSSPALRVDPWPTSWDNRTPYRSPVVLPPDQAASPARLLPNQPSPPAGAGRPAPHGRVVRRLRPGDEALLDMMGQQAAGRYLADSSIYHWVAVDYGYRIAAHLGAQRQRRCRDGDRLLVHELSVRVRHGREHAAGLLLDAAALAANDLGLTGLHAVAEDPVTEEYLIAGGLRKRSPQPVCWERAG